MLESEYKSWNVVFLVDSLSPSKVVLLKRAANKSFAPNKFTGIGGKIEPGENPLESANRELLEETKLHMPLFEFARVHILPDLMLYYFYGIFNASLPKTDDGTLFWMKTREILGHDVIPTTKRMLEEWSRRGYKLDKPFTLVLHESEPINDIRPAKIIEVKEGLVDF